jgi:DNA (cytosine-5)-methyltransferase 1
MKLRLLDLYCCGGGAAEGYHRAGFDVVGVDIKEQPRYPGAFIRTDVLSLDLRFLRFFDAIHASPPCQFGTELNSDKNRHLNLIPQTRALLKRSGLPYVIENVRAVREHLVDPVSLFGTMFGLHMVTSKGQRFVLSRERLFETNWELAAPHDPGAQGHPVANVFGGHLRARSGPYRTGKGTGRTRDFPGEDRPALARQLMGMPWASMGEMSEAIPPAYTEWLGRELLSHLHSQRAAA